MSAQTVSAFKYLQIRASTMKISHFLFFIIGLLALSSLVSASYLERSHEVNEDTYQVAGGKSKMGGGGKRHGRSAQQPGGNMPGGPGQNGPPGQRGPQGPPGGPQRRRQQN